MARDQHNNTQSLCSSCATPSPDYPPPLHSRIFPLPIAAYPCRIAYLLTTSKVPPPTECAAPPHATQASLEEAPRRGWALMRRRCAGFNRRVGRVCVGRARLDVRTTHTPVPADGLVPS